ncbi:hypothetical protein BKA69DRAFT_1175729 [Paraphysoderma sedebokerense]|nr:hypothetical protein BKA69DRAFT_1175729 [Paraphysoderma sedebokerense]
MASVCPIITAQGLATVACLTGITIAMATGILTSPALFTLRTNPFVFCCIAFGTMACTVYSIYTVHIHIVPLTELKTIIFSSLFAIYSYCLYGILVERTIPLIPKAFSYSPGKRQLVRFLVPFVLNFPQLAVFLIDATTGHIPNRPMSLIQANVALVNVGLFFLLVSELALSVMFINTLTKYRKKSFQNFLIERKDEAATLLVGFIVPFVYMIVKLATVYESSRRFPTSIFEKVHSFGHPIVILISFYTFLYTTTKVPREILHTKIEISQKGTETTAKKTMSGQDA